MYGGVAVIIGMVGASVVSSISQSILISQGKQTEAQYIDLATKSGLVVTALALFARAVSTMATLG